ncbi:VOC family protein [Undibacterium sp. Di27W]|uniref:VOC family protein n=1 Tax=Undibacterium sp. Di27W TaxID=3413036 RepID=UPI003BF42F5E
MSNLSLPIANRSLTPYLIVQGATAALEFYTKAFGARELVRLDDGKGKIMHAELDIGDARIMLADEFPDMGYRGPRSLGGSTVSLHLYVDDVDTVFARAVELGATATMPVADQFDGDRRGTLTDPFGHVWLLASRKEDVSYEELRARFANMMGQA